MVKDVTQGRGPPRHQRPRPVTSVCPRSPASGPSRSLMPARECSGWKTRTRPTSAWALIQAAMPATGPAPPRTIKLGGSETITTTAPTTCSSTRKGSAWEWRAPAWPRGRRSSAIPACLVTRISIGTLPTKAVSTATVSTPVEDLHSRLVLGVAGGSTANGAPVVQWTYNAFNQLWLKGS